MTTALAKTEKKRRDPREAAFLERFFLDGAERGHIKEAAIAAGYDDEKARAVGERILERFDKVPFAKSLIAAGVTKPLLAMAIKDYIKDGGPDGRQAIRMAMSAYGEGDGQSQPSINVMGQGAQVLVVVGKTDERMKRLKAGGSPVTVEEVGQ